MCTNSCNICFNSILINYELSTILLWKGTSCPVAPLWNDRGSMSPWCPCSPASLRPYMLYASLRPQTVKYHQKQLLCLWMRRYRDRLRQNRRQKIFNRGALRLYMVLDILKFDRNSWFIVFFFQFWWSRSFVWGLSPPTPRGDRTGSIYTCSSTSTFTAQLDQRVLRFIDSDQLRNCWTLLFGPRWFVLFDIIWCVWCVDHYFSSCF